MQGHCKGTLERTQEQVLFVLLGGTCVHGVEVIREKEVAQVKFSCLTVVITLLSLAFTRIDRATS